MSSEKILDELESLGIKKNQPKTIKSFRLNANSIATIDRYKDVFKSESELVDVALQLFAARFEKAEAKEKSSRRNKG